MDGLLTMEDIEMLAYYHDIGKPPIFGARSDPGRDIWLGTEMLQIINDTEHMGPVRL